MKRAETFDVVIVGSGIMGAIMARQLRRQMPGARIAMIEAGPPIGSLPGQHLHDSPEPGIWQQYNRAVAADNQALYIGPEFMSGAGIDPAIAEPGIYEMGSLGEASGQMPGASLSWNLGGMGVHWTATTPIPWGGECFAFGNGARWNADLAEARRALEVDCNPFGIALSGTEILTRLTRRFGAASAPGRAPQTMPMAVAAEGFPPWPRIGPARIFPGLQGGDPNFTLIGDTIVTGLEHRNSRVSAAQGRNRRTGEACEIKGHSFAICADTMRTPQLLHASGIRPQALGAFLNEHAFLGRTIRPDPGQLDTSNLPEIGTGEWRAGSYWLPHSDAAQPFHGQIVETYQHQEKSAEDYMIGLTWYAPTEIRRENRLSFSDTETDALGLPKITVNFDHSARDREMIERAGAELDAVAIDLGGTPGWECLTPGSSLHFTGTVRMGASDDGTSVCSPDARVWGWENLYVAGNGVIPTAMLGNTTLTGAVTAVRAAYSIIEAAAETTLI